MLESFNNGDMHQYDKLCEAYASVLNSLPSMVANERMLRQKITILALTELVFRQASHQEFCPDQDMILAKLTAGQECLPYMFLTFVRKDLH